MNLLKKTPLTIAEAQKHVPASEEKQALHDYFKKFSSVSLADAKKMEQELHALNNPKIRQEEIVKLIDFLPKESEEVNKIFMDSSLSEEEINGILAITTKH